MYNRNLCEPNLWFLNSHLSTFIASGPTSKLYPNNCNVKSLIKLWIYTEKQLQMHFKAGYTTINLFYTMGLRIPAIWLAKKRGFFFTDQLFAPCKTCTRIMRALATAMHFSKFTVHSSNFSVHSSKFSMHPVKHLPCACAYDVWICHCHVSNNFIFIALFEMFSHPLYKTDDTQAYFVDQWEWMHSLTLETV